MIFRIIRRMACPFNGHTLMVSQSGPAPQPAERSLPAQRAGLPRSF